MRKHFYSFDVFDTCLSRACGDSINVFTILSERILGANATLSQIADFRYIRITGELNARRNTKKEDITFDEIYEKCDFTALSTLSINEIKDIELDVERSILCPIDKSYNLISELHSKGHNVTFISDMYLPSCFLIEILKKFSFWKDGDSIYVSGELGKCKSTGSLFKYVLKKEKISRWLWLHYGDNFYSDFINPMRLGISARLIRNNYSCIQKEYKNNDFNPVTNTFSIVSGISNSICRENSSDIRVKFASDLIAPLYVPFVYHVLLDAKRKGIDKLYFLARDGFVFYKIAQVFLSLFPEISINYLYVSRKSLYLPSLITIDRNTINELFSNNDINNDSIRELLDYFQIEFDDHFRDDYHKKNIGFIDYLCSKPDYISRIERKRKEQKDNCLRYFIQEGLADNSKRSAIIDLRGTRRCQQSINSILASAGYNSVFAYYLEANYNRIKPKTGNDYDAIVFGDFFNRNFSYKGLDIAFILLEHYFSITPYKRTSGYIEEDGKILVTFDESQVVNSHSEDICNINISTCQSFAAKFLATYIYKDANFILDFSLRNLSNFMRRPNRKYLKALLNVSVSESQIAHKYIVKYFSTKDFFSKNIMWYDGSVMLVFGTPVYLFFVKIIRKCHRLILRLL